MRTAAFAKGAVEGIWGGEGGSGQSVNRCVSACLASIRMRTAAFVKGVLMGEEGEGEGARGGCVGPVVSMQVGEHLPGEHRIEDGSLCERCVWGNRGEKKQGGLVGQRLVGQRVWECLLYLPNERWIEDGSLCERCGVGETGGGRGEVRGEGRASGQYAGLGVFACEHRSVDGSTLETCVGGDGRGAGGGSRGRKRVTGGRMQELDVQVQECLPGDRRNVDGSLCGKCGGGSSGEGAVTGVGTRRLIRRGQGGSTPRWGTSCLMGRKARGQRL